MKKQNDDMLDATRYLMKALETSMYIPKYSKETFNLKRLLTKLGIKSAKDIAGSTLQMESLEETINAVANNFGKPDILMMDPKHLEAFTKATKK